MTDQQMRQRARDERLEDISVELRRRIHPVCPDMPDDLFLEMVGRMATIQLKYELLDDSPATT